MRVIVLKNEWQVGLWSALYVSQNINLFKKKSDADCFTLAVPTGATSLVFYKVLIELYRRKFVSFKDVMLFNLDEYLGLKPDHPASFAYFVFNNFVRHVDFPINQVSLFNGSVRDTAFPAHEESGTVSPANTLSPQIRPTGGLSPNSFSLLLNSGISPQELSTAKAEAARVESLIESLNGLRIVVAGVGRDGHIGFNEPGSSLSSKTRIKTLNSDTLEVNSSMFQSLNMPIPTRSITMGVGTMMGAKEVIVMATGRKKALAIQAAIEGPVTHQWPISALQMHPRAVVVCDEEAAEELKVKTVKYYRSLEQQELEEFDVDSLEKAIENLSNRRVNMLGAGF